jgi:hypothetical protein
VRAEIKYLHSPDVEPDLETYRPDDPEDVGLLVQVIVGAAGEPGEESFDVMVCTPRWLDREARRFGPLIGRHYLVVARYDFAEIRAFITKVVDAENAPTWRELAERLGRFGHWEFEDYQPNG